MNINNFVKYSYLLNDKKSLLYVSVSLSRDLHVRMGVAEAAVESLSKLKMNSPNEGNYVAWMKFMSKTWKTFMIPSFKRAKNHYYF